MLSYTPRLKRGGNKDMRNVQKSNILQVYTPRLEGEDNQEIRKVAIYVHPALYP
jgi:hypothetical protein